MDEFTESQNMADRKACWDKNYTNKAYLRAEHLSLDTSKQRGTIQLAGINPP